MDSQTIKHNIQSIQRTLPEGVTLCAVTKYHSVEETQAVVDAGIFDLGENKVQDLLAKQQAINDPRIRWHLIGHLQTNKVKKIIGHTALIHSVDSLKLINALEKAGAEQGVVTSVLLQIDLTEDENKTGLHPEELPEILAALPDKKHICLRGIMGMGSVEKKLSENRKIFKTLREIYDTIKENYLDGFNAVDTLSMGMTDDYPVAIEEEATIVRIGRKIFEKQEIDHGKRTII